MSNHYEEIGKHVDFVDEGGQELAIVSDEIPNENEDVEFSDAGTPKTPSVDY